jgi:hypothetical protein
VLNRDELMTLMARLDKRCVEAHFEFMGNHIVPSLSSKIICFDMAPNRALPLQINGLN